MAETDFIGTEAATGRIRVVPKDRPPGSPVAIGGVSDKTATIRMNLPRGSLSWRAPEQNLPSIRIAAPVDSVIPVAGEGRKIDKKTLFRADSSPSPNSSATLEAPVDSQANEVGAPQDPLTPRQKKRPTRKGKKRVEKQLDDTQALLRIDDGFEDEFETEDRTATARELTSTRTVIEPTRNWPLLLCSSLFCLLTGLLLGVFVVAPRVNTRSEDPETVDAEPEAHTPVAMAEPMAKKSPPRYKKKSTPPRATPQGSRIKRLVLTDARTGAEIQEITPDAKINVLGKGPLFDIRAETVPEKVGFVSFAWNGRTMKLDREAPYTFLDDNWKSIRKSWCPKTGENRILAIPYKKSSGNNVRGEEMRVNFSIIGFSGLCGKYYSTPDLTGTAQVRSDPKIDFDWGSQPPIRGIIGSGYSVSWEGLIIPKGKGVCRFTVIADGDVRLWIGKSQIIKKGSQSHRIYTGVFRFKNRRERIRLDFLNVEMRGVIQMNWKFDKAKGMKTNGGIVPTEALLPVMLP